MYHISECLHNCEQNNNAPNLFDRLYQNYLQAQEKENQDLDTYNLGLNFCPDFQEEEEN